MKKFYFAFIFAFIIGLPFVLSACSSKTKLINVYSVSFYNRSLSVAVGSTVKLDYKVFPVNASNKGVEFTSLDPSAATVSSDGEVTLIKNKEVDIIVRTKDGGFESTCTIVPLVQPEEILVNSSQTEEKYDSQSGDLKDVLVIGVGQTKLLPFSLLPEGASATSVTVNSDNSNVEVVYGAEWLVVGKKVGISNITLKYKTTSLTIPVWVEPEISTIEMLCNDDTILLNYEKDKFVGSLNLDLRGDNRLSLKFLDSKMAFSNQLKLDALVSDPSILRVDICDTFDEYKTIFATDENDSAFNFIKYMNLTLLADGQSKICFLCDCQKMGKPVLVELNVIVSDEVGKIVPKIDTNFANTNNQVVFVGDAFDVLVDKFARIGGSEYLPITADRKIYYSIESNEESVRPIKAATETSSVYFESGCFTALEAKKNATIWVYVAKTASTPDIYELSQSEIDSLYVKERLAFDVEHKIEDIWVEYKNEYLLDNGTVAIKASIDDEILINDVDGLYIGVMTQSGDFVEMGDCSWTFKIEISNDVVEIQDNKIVLKKDGTASVKITVFNGVDTLTKSFDIVVVV